MYVYFFKRLIDIVASFFFLLLTLPLTIPVTILLFIGNNGKPFFFQKRPGKNERIFRIIKYKTMNDKVGSDGALLSDQERLTPVGNFVRKTSLDELPQLVNVLKGEMSLVGPRPLIPEYLPHYSAYHRKRHNVKPGITGLAQVIGRNKMKFSKRFELDVEYVGKMSFLLDCKIILMTIAKVFNGSDIALGQTVEEVDDLGITKTLPSHYFKKTSI